MGPGIVCRPRNAVGEGDNRPARPNRDELATGVDHLYLRSVVRHTVAAVIDRRYS